MVSWQPCLRFFSLQRSLLPGHPPPWRMLSARLIGSPLLPVFWGTQAYCHSQGSQPSA